MSGGDSAGEGRGARARRLFLAALEKPPSERRALVAQSCRGDTALERTVLELLEAYESPGRFDRMKEELPLWQVELLDEPGGSETEGGPVEPPLREPPSSERYRIDSLLGRGGMGEVWRAFDLKLRIDVALKWLRPELVQDRTTLELLRGEVTAARDVISANVCRVFDLQEIDEREVIAMELVDGTTLRRILDREGPLELDRAQEMASQLLAGLAAIHEAGFVHRDIKPDNVMITHTGRVVVMDLGIARGVKEPHPSSVAGTLAYMSPEQRKGESLDARADLFSTGVVLAEMVEPSGVGSREAREALWERLRRPKPEVSATPWSGVIARAVAADPRERYPSATALSRALEEVTLRAVGDEDSKPYPGLQPFERSEAQFFFARELEVEALCRRLRPPRLLAVIGASGAGKSSFLRAGLLAALPDGWSTILTTPGGRPFVALARALAEVLPGDAITVDSLLRFEEPAAALALVSRWRYQHDQCLVVLDQFEEVLTQNPPHVQAAFCDLLSRLPLEADVHVLLAMRDDFLGQCQAFESLAPLFSDVTPLGPPTGAALRRAIVQPALRCGYRFEDEALVEEMLARVEGERGSLPMVAFTAAELWELRDRERGLLTREAYERIGGVDGALAQHADRTLSAIGEDNVPVVRELFRNLVTAQGTRASRTRHQLLSVFERPAAEDEDRFPEAARETASRVLDTLIDARLLTSYEAEGAEADRDHRTSVEIVHESLLGSWPRLSRWQARDAESAVLRDQLRQSAQSWSDRGRPDDLLWTGTSYREFELWRERYPGGLSDEEKAFAHAMEAFAERRKRRRRVAMVAAFAALLVVLAVVLMSREQARREARHAEANELLALGRLEIEENPTGALAYAIASLERSDSAAGRWFALETLWSGPPALLLEGLPTERTRIRAQERSAAPRSLDWSPDGRWLVSGHVDGTLKLWSNDGSSHLLGREESSQAFVRFGSDPARVVSKGYPAGAIRVRSLPDGEILRTLPVPDPADFRLARDPDRIFTFSKEASGTRVQSWPFSEGPPVDHGVLESELYRYAGPAFSWTLNLDPSGRTVVYSPALGDPSGTRDEVYVAELEPGPPTSRQPTSAQPEPANDDLEARLRLPTRARKLGRHPQHVARAIFDLEGRHVISADGGGEVRFWRVEEDTGQPVRTLRQPPPQTVRNLRLDPAGSRIAAATWSGHAALWALADPPAAEAVVLTMGNTGWTIDAAFHPDGKWVATATDVGIALYATDHPVPLRLPGHTAVVRDLAFLPDGKWLASASADSTVRLWPLSPGVSGGRPSALFEVENDWAISLDVDKTGTRLLVGTALGEVWEVPLDGTDARRLADFATPAGDVSIGTHLAAMKEGLESSRALRLVDLETGRARDLDLGVGIRQLELTADDRLLVASDDGVRVWSVEPTSLDLLEAEVLSDRTGEFDLSADGRHLLVAGQGENDEAAVFDLTDGTKLLLVDRGPVPGWRRPALGPSGRVALTIGERVQVGPIDGASPHVLVAQGQFSDPFGSWVISPDGRWIASATGDSGGEKSHDIHLWPMPDFSQPPLHTLPHEELLDRLRALTNLRVVEESASETGWGWALGPFPGWETVPRW